MKIWFTLIDFSMPLVMAYLVFRKGSLSIVYVPFFYFMYSMLEKSRLIAIYQYGIAFLLIYYVIFNLPFLKKNFFFIIFILFVTFQLRVIDDFKFYRNHIFGLYWLFTIIALAPEICKNYKKEQIFNELSKASFLILLFFVINTSFATVLRYFPITNYGFTTGVSFGNISNDQYNVLPLAVFLVFRKGVFHKNFIYVAVALAALFLTLLTLRRVAMLLSILACLAVIVEIFSFDQIKKIVMIFLILGIAGVVVIKTTGFAGQLQERIEKRNLEERDIEGEGRFREFGLLYKDLFVFYDYDPWFGNGPFQSSGNYGKRIFGDRPLHSEIPLLIHEFGFFGLFLFLSMISLSFYQSWLKCLSRNDRFIYGFLLCYFLVYMVNGFPRNPMSPVLLFMTLSLPFASNSKVNSKSHEFSTAMV